MSTVKLLKVAGIFMETSTLVAPLVDADSEVPLTQNNSVCGEVLIDPFGGFQSPNFPGAYPAHSRCQWNISVPQAYAAINITFDHVDIEHEDDCRHDHIIIYDEIGNQIGCRRCGKYKSPVNVQIRGRKAVIVFHSDDSVNKSGFRASYKGALSVGNIYP